MIKEAELFGTFAKIGCFTFGGGYAMISLIEDSCVDKKKWITHDEMMNVVVIAESTPGPISINCATFVGYRRAGMTGAIASTIGVALPSFLIIFFLANFLDSFLAIPWVARAFQGIQIAVGILIIDAGVTMFRKMKKEPFPCIVLALAFVTMFCVNLFSLHLSSIVMLVTAAAAGLILTAAKGQGAADKAGKTAAEEAGKAATVEAGKTEAEEGRK